MFWGIVYTAPADVFKAYATLVSPIILFEQRYHITQVIDLLNRHNLLTFSTKRIVQRNSQMTITLLNKAFEPLIDTYRRYRNTFGRPCATPCTRHRI